MVEGFAFAHTKVIRVGYRSKGFYFSGNASVLKDTSGKRYLFISAYRICSCLRWREMNYVGFVAPDGQYPEEAPPATL